MQALVYLLIALSSAGLGALAYFGLTFTPANAILVAVVFACACVVLMERMLRQRAENRLERAIEDLSRLLATDAQAGAVLGQRINAIADLNPGQRLETVEADISVLGTVIRQVAEAVAEVEDKVARSNSAQPQSERADARLIAAPPPPPAAVIVPEIEPVIPLEMLRQAIEENRLIHHMQPIVKLPQRRASAYDLMPRLRLEDGELADAPDFMPRRGGKDIVRLIEGTGLVEAVAIARRSRTGGQPAMLHIPLTRASLGDQTAAEQLLVTLDANRAIAGALTFLVPEVDWLSLNTHERAVVEQMVRKGGGFSIANMKSLRVDVADMAAMGVRSLRVDAGHFVDRPEDYTDFHITDIANYLARFEVSLLATGVSSERQIVELLDSDILLVQGDHIAPPGPVRSDLAMESTRTVTAQMRRAE
ncbi:cyclic-di-GMP phosphodiesterase, flagellum assembly factor TipF [Devosia lucknowensis]|uniref:Cyclic-di-GMP phosphodiesterase, flagellum assembly factor TipF n=1 Tax=Devosia lucknowensis TaxID=1096929 RepID=A0A1Y6EE48_9HYPH|nr:EAL domain-containing protein [Devosia lucknowensis]SMQ59200.1 cyclic-di-GMP phosphodiesterase, flagellum assembly factor TipF [Devosia lucknowensis]